MRSLLQLVDSDKKKDFSKLRRKNPSLLEYELHFPSKMQIILSTSNAKSGYVSN
jgi:hypothetical protein